MTEKSRLPNSSTLRDLTSAPGWVAPALAVLVDMAHGHGHLTPEQVNRVLVEIVIAVDLAILSGQFAEVAVESRSEERR